jgi:hypothetical protein
MRLAQGSVAVVALAAGASTGHSVWLGSPFARLPGALFQHGEMNHACNEKSLAQGQRDRAREARCEDEGAAAPVAVRIAA